MRSLCLNYYVIFKKKIESLPHDVLIKIVVDFYSKEDIHFTKTLLFDKCKETAIRLKKYNVDSARLDCRDITNKLNKVCVDCPIFVAQDVDKLPLLRPTSLISQKFLRISVRL